MRTSNCKCEVCGKPLYRRPFELAKIRYVACMEHRYEMQRRYESTDAQKAALELGRCLKGTNRLEGIPKSPESNRKRSESHKAWCAANPDKVAARAKKIRGENHYLWNGGSSRLNTAIRRLTEHRNWMDAIKSRDLKCKACGSQKHLESHHIIPLALLVEKNGIKNRDQARECAALWDLSNGITLCQKCHYRVHGRKYAD